MILLPRFNDTTWRQINFRNAASLLTAEFLHGLYNQHNPFLNPYRFANTVVKWEPWQATSYAPKHEWDLIALRFGGRILRKPDQFHDELLKVVNRPRTRSKLLTEHLAELCFRTETDDQLLDTLIDSHHIALGDIYEINAVQVEHALHFAIRTRLIDNGGFDTQNVNQAICRLIESETPLKTAYQEDFLKTLRDAATDGKSESEVVPLIEEFLEKDRIGTSAYGTSTTSTTHLITLYRNMCAASATSKATQESTTNPGNIDEISEWAIRDKVTSVLAKLSMTLGEFRDRNKQILGGITVHWLKLLNEIQDRRSLPNGDCRLYTLEELAALIEYGVSIHPNVVEARRNVGVTLTRKEYSDLSNSSFQIAAL